MLERVREEVDAAAAIAGAADLRERAGVRPAGLTSTPNEAGARLPMRLCGEWGGARNMLTHDSRGIRRAGSIQCRQHPSIQVDGLRHHGPGPTVYENALFPFNMAAGACEFAAASLLRAQQR